MNYYPQNFYSNYPYQQQVPVQTAAATTIPGKMVENLEMVKIAEIPFGGYSVFPKADFSEIYIKMWNNNGTTKIIEFKPLVTEQIPTQEENLNLILSRLEQLETKLDSIALPAQKRKELNINDY